MPCFIFKKCCFFLNLRIGTFIIAVICAATEFMLMVINFSEIWSIHYIEHEPGLYIYLQNFTLFVFMVFSWLKLALCASLYVGLLEKRPDHLEMWYKGYILCEILYIAFTVLKAINESETADVLFWLILMTLQRFITFYFILVVRSYHHQMCRQPNYYQDFSCTQTMKTYCEKPKDANGDIILFSAPTKEKQGGLNPNFNREVGGMVYATPQSSQMNLPVMPSFLLNNDYCPGIDLMSHSKTTKNNCHVSFEN